MKEVIFYLSMFVTMSFFKNIFCVWNSRKLMIQLQQLHFWQQPMENMNPLTLWYIGFIIILFLVHFWWTINKCRVTEKLQGVKPIGLSDPLDNSYPNNCSETKKCHQNV